MHAIHKLIASASNNAGVVPGEIVKVNVDIAGINDIYLIVLDSYKEMGGGNVWDVNKVVLFLDHNAPSPNIKGSENQKAFRQFAHQQRISNLFNINRGICHITLPEEGMVKPGSIVVITDSHATVYGAFGALGTGVGSTDMACILMEGKLWLKVPEIINIRLEGRLPEMSMAKDIALTILGELGTDFANYKVIEFSGLALQELSMDERMVLTNMAVEMGAKSGYIQPDKTTVDYLNSRGVYRNSYNVYETDQGYQYHKEYSFDISEIKPKVALPFSPQNVNNVEEYEDVEIDQVFIGSCTGGKLTDIAVAAGLLKGKKIAPNIRLIVTMASQEIIKEAIRQGYYQILLDAGAAITVPGCGACGGGYGGVLASGETCASTSNRNFPGRMGGDMSKVYLVSPATAAATAITGRLTDPRNIK